MITNGDSIIAQPKPVPSSSRPLPQAEDLVAPESGSSPFYPTFSDFTGPTFLSAASTPSPPPSPPKMPGDGYPNPLRSNPVSPRNTCYLQNSLPISPPSTVTSPMGKQTFSSLTPLPLSPPILKPSSKPPLSLDAPNPTTRANFSPTVVPATFANAFADRSRLQSSEKNISHSASASVSNTTTSQPRLKNRSPSLSQIHTYLASSSSQQTTGPPSIPLRISSIPADTQPRKLSLQHLRSNSNLKSNKGWEKGNLATTAHGAITPSRSSPPLNTNKELPSPPSSDRRVVSDPEKRKGSTGWQHEDHPGIAELPATSIRHSRQQSQPVPSSGEWGSYAHYYDKLQSSVPGTRSTVDEVDQSLPPSKDTTRSSEKTRARSEAKVEERKRKEAPKSESKKKNTASGKDREKVSSASRPAQMSRTQKEKDRKKRNRARIITEHVDLIKDDFWEKRPWILSGKTC